ncbi:MAG: HindIII family type II restriction endonuclease [Chlorobi bacterium]|nr:MAG: Type-2 restriction enzyme HindIII [Chlorobi bacterium OLB7]MBK8911672.1 HindIII family type II restriction endonuclease [Chlorobiota bacterium]MBX7216585.1 HindIII family type II restriction endonuclease [Candidatus Kapabacteria bacterium]
MKVISNSGVQKRLFWIEEIRKLSGKFSDDYERLAEELAAEIANDGIASLIDHLRLCGNIPESYNRDSSEEKLYSKYTDCLLSLSFNAIGLKSIVLSERSDAADVEVFATDYSFVADAKSFRLSRTAKNQKDFKIQAMDTWKRGKPNAVVVCPIYQLPKTSSQIYQSATSRNVCILTYSHISLIVAYSKIDGKEKAQKLLHEIFKTVPQLPLSKNATDYWMGINRTMLEFSESIQSLWQKEKQASLEAVSIAKEADLFFLAQQRESIMRMSHEEALMQLIKIHKIDSKIKTIQAIADNGLFAMQ